MSHNAAIVFCLDEQFVPPARTLIESIIRNGGAIDDVALVVVTTGLTASSAAALEESASRAGLPIAIRTVGNISPLGSVPRWAISTCLRLYVGDLCHDFQRALYLDADMLVLSPLMPVIDFDLGGRTCAAVVNYPPLNVIRVAIPRSRRGAVNGDMAYFNAGVLLIDTDRWRRRSIGQQSRAFISRFPTTRLFDQDALNMTLADDWCPLDKEWNTPAGSLADAPVIRGLAHVNPSMGGVLDEWERAQKQPRILHFTGQPKPWEAHYPWPELGRLYREYILPEFGSIWPSSQQDVVVDTRSGQRSHEFRRV